MTLYSPDIEDRRANLTVNTDHCEAPRILMFSERNIYETEVWRCAFHEFEGILQAIDAVDVVAPHPGKWYKGRKRLACRLGQHFTTPINPGIPPIRLNNYYDLFFAVCEKPSELLNVNSLRGWKDHCKTSVCWLTEFYVRDMPEHKSCLEVLSQFDFVFSVFHVLEPFRRVLGGECLYLPGAIDAFRFCPYPNPPKRSIDVLSIGRRSDQTHEALLRMSEEHGSFYVYDTLSNLASHNLHHHRMLLANMGKRSRYFIANPGKVDVPGETGNQSEFGYRHFEGAAAGAIIVGERPRNKEFEKIFHWKDALLDVPFGSEEIAAVIREFDKQPDRQIAARKNNIVQMLLHHDWVYRWEHVLGLAGIKPLPRLEQRKIALKQRAELVLHQQIEP